ncbi:hypothetical protein LCGC14_0788140, partial [marine sediment metagenome]
RIEQAEYDAFLDLFIQAVKKRWPEVLLQFEDFNQTNALPLLTRYRDQLCCFNDDIQGTAAVTVGTLLAACNAKNEALSQQRIVFAGAGSAGCGIAEQIIVQMCSEGLSELQARSQVYMVDRHGLLTQGMVGLPDFQQALIQTQSSVADWQCDGDYPSLTDVIQNIKPTVLIGVSGQPGLFNQTMIETMSLNCDRPIIFPLSNPSRNIEATPEQLVNWTKGMAIIATGSPFKPVEYQGQHYSIPQCNNSYIFPGFGLAVVAGGVKRVSDEMLVVASEQLAQASPRLRSAEGALLPSLAEMAELSKKMAFAISKVGQQQGLAPKMSDDELTAEIDKHFWQPEYRKYTRVMD